MKNIILAFIISSTLYSCSKDTKKCTEIAYEQMFNAKIGDNFCLPNGVEFNIKSINDGKCPCHVVCVWEGIIGVQLEVTLDDENIQILKINDKTDVIKNDSLQNFKPKIINVLENGKPMNCVTSSAEAFELTLIIDKD